VNAVHIKSKTSAPTAPTAVQSREQQSQTVELIVEKPENGLRGLKHWKHDLVAGLIISLVSVPLSLGIAVASGAPPICGLISSIIAGLIFPFIGGANVTISGPAAGLAPVILSCMITLGCGDPQKGYPLVLAAICMAGVLQLVLCYFKAARLAAMFPSSAIEGMLAAIGLMIIAKQIPACFGQQFEAHEFFPILGEIPVALSHVDFKALFIALVCLGILFSSKLFQRSKLRCIPTQLVVVFVGIALGQLLGLNANLLIHIPDNPIAHGIVMPDFVGLFHSGMWWTIAGCVISLCLVDGVESLATVQAIDKIDPWRRKSNSNRTLLAMGVSNICSSLVGGLTIIPGGIKSTTCVMSGGRTLWANFYTATFLLLYVFIAKDLINMIPFAVLAAVLIHIGYKLCAPHIWKHVASIGPEQLLIFSTTVLVTLGSDLLWGLICGMFVKLLIAWRIVLDVMLSRRHEHLNVRAAIESAVRLFKNPVTSHRTTNGVYHVRVNGPVCCFNAVHMNRELEMIPADCSCVKVHLAPSVGLVDHTSAANLLDFKIDHWKTTGQEVELIGLDALRMVSADKTSMRLAHTAH
jgi:carbonic anhydrase